MRIDQALHHVNLKLFNLILSKHNTYDLNICHFKINQKRYLFFFLKKNSFNLNVEHNTFFTNCNDLD